MSDGVISSIVARDVTDLPAPFRDDDQRDPRLATLFETALRTLRVQLRRRLGNAHEADDLAQEAFLRVWSARTPIHEPDRFLARVAGNLLRDRYRHRARWQMEAPDSAPEADEAPSAERVLAAREELLLVRRAIEALPRRDRHVFEQHLDGASAGTIAAELGLSRRRVEQILARTLLHLDEVRRAAAGEAR